MHFDETKVSRRITFEERYFFHSTMRRFYAGQQRIFHQNTVRVGLIEPLRFEVASERTRSQESGFVALPLLFRKAHDFNPKRQALAILMQLAHTHHRCEDA